MFGSTLPFDPAGQSGDLFFDLFWRGIEHAIPEEEDYFSDDRTNVPVNPDARYLHGFAINYRCGASMVPGMKTPNLQITDGRKTAALWLVPPVDSHAVDDKTGKPKALNLLRMVRSSYAGHLDGA